MLTTHQCLLTFASVSTLLLIELTGGVLAAVVDHVAADDVLLAGVSVSGVSVLASTIMRHADVIKTLN